MTRRAAELDAFLAAVRAGFETSQADVNTAECVRKTFALLDGAVGRSNPGPSRLLACASLPEALATAGAAVPHLAAVATAFAALEPSLAWTHRSGGPSASTNFMEGHANAMVVGPGGFEDRRDAWVGVSLLRPRVRYPDHQHAPEEVYLALSPGEFRQGDGAWFEPGIGGTFFNKPNIVHAMRSHDAPLFAVWCLCSDDGA